MLWDQQDVHEFRIHCHQRNELRSACINALQINGNQGCPHASKGTDQRTFFFHLNHMPLMEDDNETDSIIPDGFLLTCHSGIIDSGTLCFTTCESWQCRYASPLCSSSVLHAPAPVHFRRKEYQTMIHTEGSLRHYTSEHSAKPESPVVEQPSPFKHEENITTPVHWTDTQGSLQRRKTNSIIHWATHF